jgi:hypothetical protein
MSIISLLVQWLWPKLIQQELDQLRCRFNNHIVRKDRAKYHPSGISPKVAMALHADYGGEQCLQPVPQETVKEMMSQLGGETLLEFVTQEYATRAQQAYDSLKITNLSLTNVWYVFEAMLPLM